MRNKHFVSPSERLLKILDKELAHMSDKYVREFRSKDIDTVKDQLESEGIDFSVPEHISKLTMSDFSDGFSTRDIDDDDEMFEEDNILSADIEDIRSYLNKNGAYYDNDIAKIKHRDAYGDFSGGVPPANLIFRSRRPRLVRRAKVLVVRSIPKKNILICAVSGLVCAMVVCASFVTLGKSRTHEGIEAMISAIQGSHAEDSTGRIDEMAERIASLEDAQIKLREIIVELSKNESERYSVKEDTYILPVTFDAKLFGAKIVLKKSLSSPLVEGDLKLSLETCKSLGISSVECGDIPASRQLVSYSDKPKTQ